MIRIASKRNRRDRGFTVTEMLVALSIAGVVASIAIPSSGDLLDRYRLSSALSQFKMDVTRARMQAIGQNRFVRIKSKLSGYVREESTDGVTYAQVGSTELLPKGVTIQFAYNGGPTFNRQGIASAATVMVISNSQGWRVGVVNVLGRLEVL